MIYKPLTNNSTPLIIEDIREYLKEDLPSQVTIDTGALPHLIGEIERLNRALLNIKDELNFAKDLIVTSDKIIIGNIPTFIRIEKEVDKVIGSDKE